MNTLLHPVLANFLPGPQWIVVGSLILVMFGSKKLPEFARALGRSMGEFKKATQEFQDAAQNHEVAQVKDTSHNH